MDWLFNLLTTIVGNVFSFLNDVLTFANPPLWIISNVLIIYIAILLLLFVFLYYGFFDPRATTGGQLIFRFSLSLFFVMCVIIVGIFINPRAANWYEYPGDLLIWRPAARTFAYAYVAYTITSLVKFLVLRKFYPHKILRAPDKLLVTPRRDTRENQVVKKGKNHG